MKKRLLASLLLAGTTSLSVAASTLAFTGVSNGSFETGSYDTTRPLYNTLVAPSTTIDGWTVVSGSVDWIGDYWPGSDPSTPPSRSVDLNGNEAGAIRQAFDTTLGNTYTVTFDLSGNPDCGPGARTLTVDATGGTTDPYSFDTGVGNTRSDMMWAPQTYSFVATGPSSTLTFTSTTTGVCGPALDNVAVTETAAVTPEPTAKSDCMNGGWQTLADVDGNGFKNQGDCVSYVATGGKNPGSVTAVAVAEKHASKAHAGSTTTTASASHHEKTNHSKVTTHASKHGHKSGH